MQNPKVKVTSRNSKFFVRVYDIVKKIPEGKVMTYGQIAGIVNNELRITNYGRRITARIVGFALHANKDPGIPCHRVVNKDGKVATNYSFGSWKEQKRKLLSEGIKFKDEMHVDLKNQRWSLKK